MTSGPRVFSIPATAPFLPTLAQALVSGELVPGFAPRADPLALAAATVFLPTRRAARAFGEAILPALGAEAALLPRIVALGEVDEEALAFGESALAAALAPAISPAKRRLVLANLVLQYARSSAEATEPEEPMIAATPAAALALADELARVLDDMTTAGVPFEALDDGLVPAAMDEYWQRSLKFLKIARRGWADYLAERGLLDPVERRDELLAREADRLAADKGGPVIAAGSTGTIPAVARLIAAIAARPDGAVVLPGLDPYLDDDSFALIDGGSLAGADIEPAPGHPQFGLKRLLKRLGIERSDVRPLGVPQSSSRERLLSEAFRPAATSERWRERSKLLAEDAAATALAGLAVVEAADAREEALALAIALRETLEEPDRTAALITPDRGLARRVAAELARWNVEVDDSAGIALGDTETGRLARLAAAAAAEALAPVPLLALLRHPCVNLGVPTAAIDSLEVAVLRGPRPAPGADGLARAIAEARAQTLHRRDPRTRLDDSDWDHAADVARRIGAALRPLLDLREAGAVPFARLVQAHRESLAGLGLNLAAADQADAQALAAALDQLESAAVDASPLSLNDYANAFAPLLAGEPPVRPSFDRHARIRILGLLEARLLQADRVLLGGLNEGTWPPETHADAWLNRPMRRQLGLDLPERRVGLTAHDFVQALGAREVVLSRARKQNGVETVASRFLQRLSAVAPAKAWKEALDRGEHYVSLARALEAAREAPEPIQRPAPKPPAAARPRRLSVTEIETLIRDPYSIYARHVLGLEPLDPIDADPGAAERGTLIHEALAEFARAYPTHLPGDALARLLECGERAFARLKDFPGLLAVWRPRFERVARWLIEQEIERRKRIEQVHAETSGAIDLDVGGQPFRLTARADRIDRRADGAISVIDYKTGEVPTLKQAILGLAPQLALEAAIAKAGGFAELPGVTRVAEVLVIKPSGGEPPGTIRSLDPAQAKGEEKKLADARKIATCDDLADYARKQVQTLLSAFADAAAPYQSIPRPKWRSRFGRYDHLARIKEWSTDAERAE